jgi:hypothetical protein
LHIWHHDNTSYGIEDRPHGPRGMVILM